MNVSASTHNEVGDLPPVSVRADEALVMVGVGRQYDIGKLSAVAKRSLSARSQFDRHRKTSW